MNPGFFGKLRNPKLDCLDHLIGIHVRLETMHVLRRVRVHCGCLEGGDGAISNHYMSICLALVRLFHQGKTYASGHGCCVHNYIGVIVCQPFGEGRRCVSAGNAGCVFGDNGHGFKAKAVLAQDLLQLFSDLIRRLLKDRRNFGALFDQEEKVKTLQVADHPGEVQARVVETERAHKSAFLAKVK